jgi:transcriptional regulator with XRE-family HTH domain
VVGSAILRAVLACSRRDSGLTQEDVAHGLDWSPSKLIRIESGRSSITKVDLNALLTRHDVAAGINASAYGPSTGPRASGDGGTSTRTPFPLSTSTFIDYEAGASFIRQTEMVFPACYRLPTTLRRPETFSRPENFLMPSSTETFRPQYCHAR